MDKYLETLKKRARESRVYSFHQLVGLDLAQILEDEKHKALYMKLAKTRSPAKLLKLAKEVAERKNVENKGAYFMRLLFDGAAKPVTHGKNTNRKK